MADLERTRTRERDPGAMTPYDIFIRSRLEFLERQNTGQVVVTLEDREYFNTKQGKLLYYINAEIHKNTCLQDWRVFTHSLISHSGKHRHQGGLVIYVIEGTGYSVVEGRRGASAFQFRARQRVPLGGILLHAVLRLQRLRIHSGRPLASLQGLRPRQTNRRQPIRL
jgi:hypothetical protein